MYNVLYFYSLEYKYININENLMFSLLMINYLQVEYILE